MNHVNKYGFDERGTVQTCSKTSRCITKQTQASRAENREHFHHYTKTGSPTNPPVVGELTSLYIT